MVNEAVEQISMASRAEIDAWIKKYPPERKQSAVLAALTIVQNQNGGWLTPALMDAVAGYLDMPRVSVYEVGSFYSMFDLNPVGRHKISVCNNISCLLNGAEDILTHIERTYGVQPGETTADGRFTLKKEEECLAACCGAPMMAVDGHYHENLTTEKVDAILGALD
ncbi:MAG: NADH-quinone oxidoreductase subunit NuoE family protein [Gammaproteobacteria bacterium]